MLFDGIDRHEPQDGLAKDVLPAAKQLSVGQRREDVLEDVKEPILSWIVKMSHCSRNSFRSNALSITHDDATSTPKTGVTPGYFRSYVNIPDPVTSVGGVYVAHVGHHVGRITINSHYVFP